MKITLPSVKKRDWLFAFILLLICTALWFVPAPDFVLTPGAFSVKAEVLETDNSGLVKHGLVNYGSQILKVRIVSGEFSGNSYVAINELRGQMDLDKIFEPGDRITVMINKDEELSVNHALNAKDFDRSGWTMVLFGIFCLLLIAFGGWTGIKALFSFIFSVLVIFKGVIPLTLHGYSASWLIFGSVVFLTAVIIFLVSGVNKKGLAAFTGAITGVFAGLLMAHLFGAALKINGAVMPYVQTMLHSGYENLNMSDIFIGALMLASSGAVMDLSMDIAAAAEEIAKHNPDLSFRELTLSGMRIGKSVVGTMTTTLLLAYSGGYLTMLMMFYIQGTAFIDMINNPLVASEMIKTLIGSFSLVLVAPLTAVASGWIFAKKKRA